MENGGSIDPCSFQSCSFSAPYLNLNIVEQVDSADFTGSEQLVLAILVATALILPSVGSSFRVFDIADDHANALKDVV